MERYNPCIKAIGAASFEKVQQSNILIVGAGGIGCELLKNMALLGFKNIEIIDLDTIDVSNLNRQFLFRPEHVGKPKALIAAEAAKAFNPDINVVAHHGNIKDDKFGVKYFAQFNIVLNALDNVDARRHVNRLCLANNIPLIDAGTTGYNGQVMPIIKNKTACYECNPKPTPKVFPICTIRSTPDKPVHCIVWGKECFKLIFGNTQESLLYEDPATGDQSAYMDYIGIPSEITVDSIVSYGRKLIEALYIDEVNKRISMDVYKTAKIPPTPLDKEFINEGAQLALSVLNKTPGVFRPSRVSKWDHTIWGHKECVAEFILGVWDALHPQGDDKATTEMIGTLAFDKDDMMAMRFVCAASNLRSSIFGIQTQSFHDAKGIAGNIIPAIAATNAIVSGVSVMQAIMYISAENNEVKLPHTYCSRKSTRKGVFLLPTTPEERCSTCYVCNTAQIDVKLDTTKFTLDDFLKKVVKGKLGFNVPSIGIGYNVIYEEGDGADSDLACNLSLILENTPAGGIRDGTIVTIEDFSQDLEAKVVIKHISTEELEKMEEPVSVDLFIINGEATAPAAPPAVSESTPAPSASTDSGNAQSTESSEPIMIEQVQVAVEQAEPITRGKRKADDMEDSTDTHAHEADAQSEPSNKKSKTESVSAESSQVAVPAQNNDDDDDIVILE